LAGIHAPKAASGTITAVSDHGVDACALDDADAAGHRHPLEIARDLIATGKPRSALEVLSLHHTRLLDDPEYLLLCSEAWWASGDAVRAQHALLGAARLAPKDPRPLRLLAEVLAERGERERAERAMAKARALEVEAPAADDAVDISRLEAEGDLIALAERQEQRDRQAMSPRQRLLLAAAFGVAALLITGLAFIASAPSAAPHSFDSAEAYTEAGDAEQASADSVQAAAAELDEPLPPAEPRAEPEVIAPPPIERAARPAEMEARPRSAGGDLRQATAPTRARASSKTASASRKVDLPPREEPLDPAVVQAELASMDPKALTERGDALHVRGQGAIAASYYRRALEIDPDYAPALVGIGWSLLRAKKYAEAMDNATRALQLARGVDARPGLEAAAIYQMGRVHFERGERDAARGLLRQSTSLPGTPPQAWFYLGEALSSDNSPAAREAYQKYLELMPEGQLASRARRAIQ
jgi:tetratricopeptide (TPR) repeat protein